MHRILKLVPVLTAATMLTACLGDDDDDGGSMTSPPPGFARVSHAVADAPGVDVSADGGVFTTQVSLKTTLFEDLMFEEGTDIAEVPPDTYELTVDARLADGTRFNIITAPDFAIESDTQYEIIAVGEVTDDEGANTIEAVVASYVPGDFTEDSIVTLLHGAPSAPTVDVHVTTPGGDISADTLVAQLDYKETATTGLAAGTYDAVITLPGETDRANAVYTASGLENVADDNVIAIVVDNTGAVPGALVRMFTVDEDGVSEIYVNDSDTASATAVHDSPDAPAVDIVADSKATPSDDNILLVDGIEYPEFEYVSGIPEGDYTISVEVDGTSVLDFDVDGVERGGEATAVVTGFATGGTPQLTALLLDDDLRSIATEGRVRLLHGSPSTGAVDIYIVEADTSIDTVDPDFSDILFGTDTGFLSLAPGTYDIILTGADSKTPALSVTDLEITGGEVLMAIARDIEGGGELDTEAPTVIDYNALREGASNPGAQ